MAWARATSSFLGVRSIATQKDDVHVVGTQGSITDAFVGRVAAAAVSYLDGDGTGEP